MKKDVQNVKIQVLKIGLKEWFSDKSLPMHSGLQVLRDDPAMHPLNLIASNDEVYQIIYSADKPTEKGGTSIEQRVFITDLVNVVDFTFGMWFINLAGCRYERLHDYPEGIDKIIAEYCFGEGWDCTTPSEEYRKWRKYRGTSDDDLDEVHT